MITRGLRSYLDRDWVAVQAAKDAYWAEAAKARGALAMLRIADELRVQMQTLHPGWPSVADRAADLEAHNRLSDRLRRGNPPSRR